MYVCTVYAAMYVYGYDNTNVPHAYSMCTWYVYTICAHVMSLQKISLTCHSWFHVFT